MAILNEYKLLLTEVDDWFARARLISLTILSAAKAAVTVAGLFDIPYLMRPCLIVASNLPLEVRCSQKKAEESLSKIQAYWPEFKLPFILNYRPEEEREALMATDNETPCALLDEKGRCLLYDYRPMTCRLHGLPLIDISGEVLEHDWCTKNFMDSDPLKRHSLRGEFNRLLQKEAALGRYFNEELLGRAVCELDTFIPTASD
jgi:Fe-S-cluster containining protein